MRFSFIRAYCFVVVAPLFVYFSVHPLTRPSIDTVFCDRSLHAHRGASVVSAFNFGLADEIAMESAHVVRDANARSSVVADKAYDVMAAAQRAIAEMQAVNQASEANRAASMRDVERMHNR